MSEHFAAACAALWTSLGLRPPAAAGRSRDLTIEDHVVTLVPSPDERAVLVSARCGTLSADLPARLGQLRDLLRNNLGLVVTNDAVLRLDAEAAPNGAVLVEALCPFGPDIVPRLTKTIENVLQLLDIQGATLKNAGTQRAALAASVPVASDESMIFRL